MGAFLGPVLLVLLGLGGLVFLVSRHRDVLAEEPAAAQVRLSGRRLLVQRAREILRRARPVGVAARVILSRALRGLGRAVARVLARPPALRRFPSFASEPRAVPTSPRNHLEIPSRRFAGVSPGWSVTELAATVEDATATASPPQAPPNSAGAAPTPEGKAKAPVSGQERPAAEPPILAETAGAPPRTIELASDVTEGQTRRVVGRVESPRVPRPPVVPPEPSRRAPRERGEAKRAPRAPASPKPDSLEALLERGEFARAEAMLVDRLTDNPRDREAYRLLGLVYILQEDFAQAREVLEEALRRDPAGTPLYGLLGRVYFALGMYAKAIQMYQLAHDSDETNLEYLEALLLIASRMDRRPLVRVTARNILSLDPNHAAAKASLARLDAPYQARNT